MVIRINKRSLTKTIGYKDLQQVQTFKYLGSTIFDSGKIDINGTIESESRFLWSSKRKFRKEKELSKKTKIVVYRSTFVPTFTHDCESGTLVNSKQKRQNNKCGH